MNSTERNLCKDQIITYTFIWQNVVLHKVKGIVCYGEQKLTMLANSILFFKYRIETVAINLLKNVEGTINFHIEMPELLIHSIMRS